jgi:hypothetical protein
LAEPVDLWCEKQSGVKKTRVGVGRYFVSSQK